MAELIDGKKISQELKEEVRDQVTALKKKGVEITLAVVLVGEDPASQVYVRNKKKACEFTGIHSLSYELPENTTEEELLKLIDQLNLDPSVDGILVQLPLPGQIQEGRVIRRISPDKDVDGFHPESVGRLSIGERGFVSCTPAGIIELLKRSDVTMDGANAVVIGRSNIVGKPMGMLLLRENATVTICHSHTKNLKEITKQADILVVAVGKPRLIDGSYIKPGAAVIDVGIHRTGEGKKLCGDVDFASAEEVAGKITPVPGGVGPMTIACLMKNCLEAARMHQDEGK